jgi:hypothetical protein
MGGDVAHCRRHDHSPSAFPAWICCTCARYNGYQRSVCKGCGHPPCYTVRPGEKLPITRRESWGLEVDEVDPPPSARVAAGKTLKGGR